MRFPFWRRKKAESVPDPAPPPPAPDYRTRPSDTPSPLVIWQNFARQTVQGPLWAQKTLSHADLLYMALNSRTFHNEETLTPEQKEQEAAFLGEKSLTDAMNAVAVLKSGPHGAGTERYRFGRILKGLEFRMAFS